MERNYEITEIRGYSGNYLRQKNGTVCYQGKLDGEENGRAPEIYLESEYEHHIHSVRKKGEKKLYTIGDITPNGTILRILLIEGEIWFNHGNNFTLNLPLKGLMSNPCGEIFLTGTNTLKEWAFSDLRDIFYSPNKLLLLL